MQNINLECIVDGHEYKEYEVWLGEQPLGIVSWKNGHDSLDGSWYTTASDGNTRYFHTQEEAIEFLTDNPLKSANELSAKLKAEANKLMDIAEEIEAEGTGVAAQEHDNC